MTYEVGYPGPGLVQAQKCGGYIIWHVMNVTKMHLKMNCLTKFFLFLKIVGKRKRKLKNFGGKKYSFWWKKTSLLIFQVIILNPLLITSGYSPLIMLWVVNIRAWTVIGYRRCFQVKSRFPHCYCIPYLLRSLPPKAASIIRLGFRGKKIVKDYLFKRDHPSY